MEEEEDELVAVVLITVAVAAPAPAPLGRVWLAVAGAWADGAVLGAAGPEEASAG